MSPSRALQAFLIRWPRVDNTDLLERRLRLVTAVAEDEGVAPIEAAGVMLAVSDWDGEGWATVDAG